MNKAFETIRSYIMGYATAAGILIFFSALIATDKVLEVWDTIKNKEKGM